MNGFIFGGLKFLIFRALYDYAPHKPDELHLRKGDLYIVIEKCRDGWFKGSSVASLKTGVFPGNYVQHIKQEEEEKRRKRREESAKSIEDLLDFNTLFKASANIVPPNVAAPEPPRQQPQSSSAAAAPSLRPPPPPPVAAAPKVRYRCVVPYPASSQYELELKEGDVIVLLRKRDDGWCKGRMERTGETGLFPASFVQKI